jgi:phosphatidylglycerophosphate synthase
LPPKTYTVSEVRSSFHSQKRWEEFSGELPALLIFRPISFWITPWFLRAGWSAAGVTLLGGAFALAMLAGAWLGGDHAYVLVAVMGCIVQTLDCVDGNIARVTGTLSHAGQFLDLLVGQLYWALLFVSIGLLVERNGGGLFGDCALEVALSLSILVLLHRVTRNYAQLHFSRKQLMDEPPEKSLAWTSLVLIGLAGLENLYVFAVWIGGAFGALDFVLLGIALYVLCVFLYVEIELYLDLRA